MAESARDEFHREMERLDISVGGLTALVPDAIGTATTALLDSDEDVVAGLQRWRRLVDELYADVDRTMEVILARQAPVAGDLRFILACVRLVPRLNEVVDLIAEMASAGHSSVASATTERVVGLVRQLGRGTADLWSLIDRVWQTKDGGLLRGVRTAVDGIAESRSTLMAELASGVVDTPVAIDMALVGRTYERLAHQAANAARIELTLVPPSTIDVAL